MPQFSEIASFFQLSFLSQLFVPYYILLSLSFSMPALLSMIVISDILFAVRGKVFFRLFSKQAQQFSLILFVCLLIAQGAYALPSLTNNLIQTLVIYSPFILAFIFTFFAFCLRLSLNKVFMVGAACFSFLAALLLFTDLIHTALYLPFGVAVVETLGASSLFPITDTFIAQASCYNVFASLALGVSMASVMFFFRLVLRRKKDDFGRDYYTFAGRFSATSALIGSLFLLVTVSAFIITCQMSAPFKENEVFLLAPSCLFALLAIISFVVCTLSKLPMRQKPLFFSGIIFVYLAFVLFLTGVSCQVYLF